MNILQIKKYINSWDKIQEQIVYIPHTKKGLQDTKKNLERI